MTFNELAKKRYSCRKLSDKPIEQEKIDKIIEAALLAPTAVNNQPFRIFIMESEESKQHIEESTKFTFGAKTFMVLAAVNDEAYVRKYDDKNFADVDASIVGTHMMLEIYDQGLATTWVGHFDAPKLKELEPALNDYELLAIFPIGYAQEDAKPAHLHEKTRAVNELVTTL